jgi:hypothetical protein
MIYAFIPEKQPDRVKIIPLHDYFFRHGTDYPILAF